MHRRGVSRGGDRGRRLFGDLARPAALERGRDPEPRRRAGRNPARASRRSRADSHSRYIEAAVAGILIGNLYLPNGNPWPGPKFDYKLAWMDRLAGHAQGLLEAEVPALLIGDYNVIPTDQDVYKPERWKKDALFAPEAKAKFAALVGQGWTDAIRHLHPDERIYTFWPYWRQSFERDSGIRIDHALLSPSLAPRLKAAGVDRDAARLGQDQRPCADLGRAEGVRGLARREIACGT